MKCPTCEKGLLKNNKIKEFMYGVYLGEFSALICNKCNESFLDSSTMKKIEEIAKEKGIWGMGVTTKITMAGNSLAIRIPKRIADYLKLREGEEAHLYPENHKLVVEAK